MLGFLCSPCIYCLKVLMFMMHPSLSQHKLADIELLSVIYIPGYIKFYEVCICITCGVTYYIIL